MKGPGDIVYRASLSRSMRAEQEKDRISYPAPVMMNMTAAQLPQTQPDRCPADSAAASSTEEVYNTCAREEVPASYGDMQGGMRMPVAQNVGGHQVYRSLMRSHDRMGTRHIGRRG